MDKDERTISQRCKDWHEAHDPFWRTKRDARRELKAFLIGDRYQDDAGEFNRDRRQIQIRGQEIQDTVRHIVAKATEKPRSLEARPVDQIDDPDAAEVMTGLVESELGNPWKCFEDEWEAVIHSARSTRLGVLWMDWLPKFGPYGEIVYSWEDGDRFMWDEAYMDPHHPLCNCLMRSRRIDVEQAKLDFPKAADWLQPDKSFDMSTTSRADRPLQSGRQRVAPNHTDDNKVTLWEFWWKNDPAYAKRKSDKSIPFAPEDRYLSCTNDCGYRSQTEGDLQAAGKLQGELPENVTPTLDEMTGEQTGGCPQCAENGQVGTLERIDARAEEETLHAYSRGKRLVILAPFSPAPDDQPIYDGKWPIPNARSFPILALTAYLEPGDPGGGQCDVDLMWDQQAAADQLDTAAVQQVLEHRNYYIVDPGLLDYKGEQWEGRDDQFNMLTRDRSGSFGIPELQIVNGTGVDPNFGLVRSGIQERLTAYRGVSDVGLVNEADKSQSGVALAQRNQVGEIPVAHFNRRKNRALSKFVGVLCDYIIATYTPARLSRLRIEGIDIVTRIWGHDLPNFDWVIEDTPDFSGLEDAKAKAFDALFGVVERATALGFDPILAVEIFCKINNLPRSIKRDFEKMMMTRQPMPMVGPDGQPLPGAGAPSGGAALAPEAAPGMTADPNAGGMALPAAA